MTQKEYKAMLNDFTDYAIFNQLHYTLNSEGSYDCFKFCEKGSRSRVEIIFFCTSREDIVFHIRKKYYRCVMYIDYSDYNPMERIEFSDFNLLIKHFSQIWDNDTERLKVQKTDIANTAISSLINDFKNYLNTNNFHYNFISTTQNRQAFTFGDTTSSDYIIITLTDYCKWNPVTSNYDTLKACQFRIKAKKYYDETIVQCTSLQQFETYINAYWDKNNDCVIYP